MKWYTKFIHSFIKYIGIDIVLASSDNQSKFIKKLIPTHHEYPKNDKVVVKRNNSIFELNRSDYMQWFVFANLKDESWKFAVDYSNKTKVILDIGANCGAFSIKVSNNLKGENKIYCFEPNPFLFKILRKNIVLNKCQASVLSIPKAVGNSNKDITFNLDLLNSGHSRISKNTGDVIVPQVTLDDFVYEEQLEGIDFIKVDVEGFEPFVIQGGLKTIKKFRPTLYIEMTDSWFRENGSSVHELINILISIGYEIKLDLKGKLSELNISELDELAKKQFNILAIFKSIF